MAGRYGETIDFLIEDLRTRPGDRIVLVDYYGVLPRDLAPLLTWPAQAAFLIPTQDFRRNALTHRYGDPDRARANWGDLDPATVLETRLNEMRSGTPTSPTKRMPSNYLFSEPSTAPARRRTSQRTSPRTSNSRPCLTDPTRAAPEVVALLRHEREPRLDEV